MNLFPVYRVARIRGLGMTWVSTALIERIMTESLNGFLPR